jgi:hydroxymethylbilane synthase
MISRRVVLASRGSPLARWQSEWVAARLGEAHPDLVVEYSIVKTTGDRFQAASLQVIGGKGAFTKEIQDALLAGQADVAVHSLKDLPTEPTHGLCLWAIPPRFDARDAWLGRNGVRFADLPRDAVVATGSLRRIAQLKHRHPTARIEPIRGNIDTRLRKFHEGAMDGMLMAMAGLERLKLLEQVTEAIDPEILLPAPGQGALAVEGRDDADTRALLAPLDDRRTRIAVEAERAFLAAMGAGCQVPLGAWATVTGDAVRLSGMVAGLDGRVLLRGRSEAPPDDPLLAGERLAEELRAQGAEAILEEARRAEGLP